MNRTLTTGAVLVLFLLSGCSSSRIINSWKTQDSTIHSWKRVLVVGRQFDYNFELRKCMEDEIVQALNKMGYSAARTLTTYGPMALQNKNDSDAKAERDLGKYQALFTITLLKQETEGSISLRKDNSTCNIYLGDFLGLADPNSFFIYSALSRDIVTRYYWEGSLFDLNSRTLIYSVQVETSNPGEPCTLSRQYRKLILQDMSANQIVHAQY